MVIHYTPLALPLCLAELDYNKLIFIRGGVNNVQSIQDGLNTDGTPNSINGSAQFRSWCSNI